MTALRERASIIHKANGAWTHTLSGITDTLCGRAANGAMVIPDVEEELDGHSLAHVFAKLKELPALITDSSLPDTIEEGELLFDEAAPDS